MSDEIETLQELGLSANEAKLYLILVKDGRMKATQLALKSGLQRRAVYDTLQQLEKKGMVGVADESGVKMFSPSPPSSLLSLLDEKRDAVEKILPKLSRTFESEEKTGASVIYGKAGIKMVLEDIIRLRADYCAYNGQAQFFETMPKTMALFSRKRKEFGIRTKYLLLDVESSRRHAQKMPLSEIKYLDPSTVSAGVWWTYADRLVLFVLPEKSEPTTIFIKNAELANTFRKSFDSMFESGAQIYRGDAGMKAILEQSLGEKELFCIGAMGEAATRYPDYFEKRYNPMALKTGIIWYDLALRSIIKTAAMKQKFNRMRFLPKDWEANPNVIWVYGDTVVNMLWRKEPVAFLVKDAHIAKAYKSYFWLLWKRAEKK